MITDNANIIKRLPSWLYKLGAQSYIDKKYPRHLFIETTATCNLTCSYCPREKIRSDMDFRLFQKIVDEASFYGARSFSLHLFGEPLLYPRIFEAISYIKKKNSGNTILLTSNGTKFNDCVDQLIKSKVDKMLWSWRPEPKWTEETTKKLKSWKKFTVRIIRDVTPTEKYEEFKKWPRVEERRLHNYGGTPNFVNGNAPVADVVSTQKRWPCYHLWLAPAVAWNGKFLMCCADPHQKEVFGDINKETVAESWQRVEKVRQGHLKGEFSGICSKCDVWKEFPSLHFSSQFTGQSSSKSS